MWSRRVVDSTQDAMILRWHDQSTLFTWNVLLAECDLFSDDEDLTDPCAEEDQTCTSGKMGYTCGGKKNDACHGMLSLFAAA